MKLTDGNWSPKDDLIIFAAGNSGTSTFSERSAQVVKGTRDESMYERSKSLTGQISKLISLLSLGDQGWDKILDKEIHYHERLFLDSGVFGLAAEHARRHDMSHNQALSTPVDQIDGWHQFVAWYIEVCTKFKDIFWGYVELDLGGTAQKIKTREYLESQGLRPIPVWHPLQDGLEYGEMLMESYDRICLGNLVKSDEKTRLTVLRALAHVKGRKKTWVHALGLAPVPFAHAFPINSLDAMTWLAPMMYPKRFTYGLMEKFEMDAPRIYDHRDFYYMGSAVLQKQLAANQTNWRHYEYGKRAAANRSDAESESVLHRGVDRIPPVAKSQRAGRVSRKPTPA